MKQFFWMWKKGKVPPENPHRQGENILTKSELRFEPRTSELWGKSANPLSGVLLWPESPFQILLMNPIHAELEEQLHKAALLWNLSNTKFQSFYWWVWFHCGGTQRERYSKALNGQIFLNLTVRWSMVAHCCGLIKSHAAPNWAFVVTSWNQRRVWSAHDICWFALLCSSVISNILLLFFSWASTVTKDQG